MPFLQIAQLGGVRVDLPMVFLEIAGAKPISWSATHKMSNWWEFVADWDAAKAAGKNLNQPK